MNAREGLIVDQLDVSLLGGSLKVVRGVSLRIASGEALGLVGESGSGKSVTARAVLGLLPSHARVGGRILYDGTSLLNLSDRERERMRGSRIGMIFQDPMSSLNPVITVGDAIAQVIRSHRSVDGSTARNQAVEMLRKVGIVDAEARARAYPHQFSGGMRQRIMIAMALAANPTLLLADEPTTALDVIVQSGILGLLDRLRRTEGMSLLFVSHDLAVVARMCERIAVMYAGQIVEEGPTRDILERPRMPYTIGLLGSIPRRGMEARLSAIPGSPPSPDTITVGCSFAPRCSYAIDACRQNPVPLEEVGPGHSARCLRSAELGSADPGAARDRRNG